MPSISYSVYVKLTKLRPTEMVNFTLESFSRGSTSSTQLKFPCKDTSRKLFIFGNQTYNSKQYSPYDWLTPKYGASTQMTQNPDISPLLNA